jgi:hypothetical protein
MVELAGLETCQVTVRDLRLFFLGLFIVLGGLAGLIETSKWLAKRRKKIGPPTIVDLLLAYFGIDSGRIPPK